MNLTTERLILRSFALSDITEGYLGWLLDPYVTRFSNQRFVQHNYQTCLQYFNSFANTCNSFLLIIHKNDKVPIGTITVYRNVHHLTADIGIMIGNKNYWGQGLGLESWSIVLKTLLSENGMRKVTAGTLSVNKAMLNIMRSSGMTLESIRKSHELVDNQPVDLLYFASFAS